MDEQHYDIDCEKVKSCVERLVWDVENLIQKEKTIDIRIRHIETLIVQVKWTVIGILGTLVAYTIGIIELVKSLIGG